MLDAVDEGGSIFYPGRTWVSDNKQMSRGMVTMHKERNCPKCLGSQKNDMYDMIISGWGGEAAHVNWGNKSPKKCFETAKHAFYGVKKEPQINKSDELQCVLYQSLSSQVNNAKEWPDTTPKPPPTTKEPTFFEERPDKIQEGLQCTKDARIIGGQNAKEGSYPWLVNLFLLNDGDDFGRLCGGSILSENWIVTAARW